MKRCLVKAGTTLLFASAGILVGAEVNDVIINEIYFDPKDTWKAQSEAVELLVVKDGVNLNGLVLSDRDVWNKRSEEQCLLQDMGQGFLSSVRSGTLIVVSKGVGEDDTDPSDFVLRIFAKTSLFCNTAPGTNAFWFNDGADNLHVFQGDKQIDFVKFWVSDKKGKGGADPGSLEWENGRAGAIDIGPSDENAGFRFLGDKPDLNNFLAPWQVYSEFAVQTNNLGHPNGGRNTKWIESLRKSSRLGK